MISELSERELCTEVVDTTKEGANNLAVWISERELCTEVDTTKKGANNLAVATKERANNQQIMEW